jgi:hypothetical protein
MARAGVGKTAFLVGIGLDALLGGQKVLHVSLDRTVDKVRSWYDDLLAEMLRRERKLEHYPGIQLEVERRRHIHTYLGRSFSPERLEQALQLLGETAEFVPQVIILDRMELESFEPEAVAAMRRLAGEVGAELWMACRTHREGPQGEPGHLPPPADRFESMVDLAFRLDPQDAKVRLHVVKDHERMLDKELDVLLDPQTMLLGPGFGAKR